MKLFILFFVLVSISFCAAEEWIVPKIVTTTGGWNALPLNSKKVIDMVKLLQDTYNKESKSLYWSKITKVEEATMQVTNGFNYHFAVIVEPTGCLKQKDFKTCNTPAYADMPVKKCHYYLKESLPKFTLNITDKMCEQI